MLGPISTAHARTRAGTLRDRHATLTNSASLYALKTRKKTTLRLVTINTRDATVTDTLPTRMQIIFK